MAHIEDRRSQGRGWRVRYRDPSGQERSKSFKRKADADRFLIGNEAARLSGRWVDPRAGRVLFGDFAKDAFDRRLHLRPATRSRDESYLRNHVVSAFGPQPLSSIAKADVQAWVRQLSEEKKLAPRTVRECFRILSSIFSDAVEERLVAESPCRGVSLPRVEVKERRFLLPDQVRDLAEAIDTRFETYVYAGAYLGLRWSELAGLKRTNLDLLRRRVKVVGSLERVGGSFRYVEETKSESSRRTVPLPPFLVDILAEYLSETPNSLWVFTSPEGGHLHYSGFRRRYWNPGVELAGLAPLTPHALRHTAAAILIDQGADPLQVQRRLGHKDISTTLRIYGHLFPDRDVDLTRRLDDTFRESLAAPPRPEPVAMVMAE